MSVLLGWIERGAAASMGVTVALLALLLFTEPRSPGRVALREHVRGLDRELAFVRAKVGGSEVVAAQGALSAVLVAAAAFGEWLALLLVPVVLLGPRVVIAARAERRVARLEEQIEPWLNAIANSLKASPSLGDAIASSTTLVAAPMSEEVDVLIKEYELGTPLDRALESLAERGRGRTLAGAVLALKVARRSGGNLTEMLESTASALRELARLEGVVRAKTAEGKAQAFVIGVVPIPMIFAIHASDPHYFEPLETTFLGNLLVAGATALWAVAVLSSRKILAVDV